MKHRRIISGLAALFAALLLLSGCYRSPGEFTWHQPHVYKGKQDPLLAKSKDGQLGERLRERFSAVQTDR